ncbi:MAG: energy-coupling factor transporter transmembrane protein EcfT [Lachnospiraceae bacterium]|nr:energy-coupling factor transporter transmembrane protein EcfT [Lachnospiraceae bacterium]
MIKDITLGQYYPVDSVLHELDPRTKLIAALLYMMTLFCWQDIRVYLLAVLVLIPLLFISNIPINYQLRGLKPVVPIMIFTGILNLFHEGEQVLVSILGLKITKEGIVLTLYVTIRFVLLMLCAALLTNTTTPTRLMDGLESILKPLKKIKVPVHEMALMMSIALRFIPTLVEEMDVITKAQMARGVDFQTKKLSKKVKQVYAVFVPLFLSTIRRSRELAEAMEARCYAVGVERTKLYPLKFRKKDVMVFIFIIIYVAAILMMKSI